MGTADHACVQKLSTGYFTAASVSLRWRATNGVPGHKPKRVFGTALATSCIKSLLSVTP